MPIIKPIQKLQNESVRLQCPVDLITEIKNYCEAFHIEKAETFFLQAAEHVLEKDKDWKRLKKSPDGITISSKN